jgi:hypothetical protein
MVKPHFCEKTFSHLEDYEDCFVWVAHGVRPKLMANLFYVGTPIVRKHINIVSNILSNKDKLYVIYIHTPTSECLKSVIENFKDIPNIQQICGVVDGTQMPLSYRLVKRIIIVVNYYYNHKHIMNIAL